MFVQVQVKAVLAVMKNVGILIVVVTSVDVNNPAKVTTRLRDESLMSV